MSQASPLSKEPAVGLEKSPLSQKSNNLIATSLIKCNGLYLAIRLIIKAGKIVEIQKGDANNKNLAIEDLKKINYYDFFKPIDDDYETNISGIKTTNIDYENLRGPNS